jgi:L-fuculose-phosphate aldolase
MKRIYQYKMTTTSGGNLSILDENGDMWITPTGVDKGALTPEDVVCVRADGRIEGLHKPSIEHPFHRSVYEARPDLKAIVHAHPTSLVAFSIAHRVPDTRLFRHVWRSNAKVAFAPYGVPGSRDLGEKIALKFRGGFDSVILENHGVCCGGRSLQDAFQRFETLEMCCKILTKASSLGEPTYLNNRQLALGGGIEPPMDSFERDPAGMSAREKELRVRCCEFIERGYRQRLVSAATGTFSARVDSASFLITPAALDRQSVRPEELVLVREGRSESGKTSGREVFAHKAIYDAHPEVGAVINACPVNAMAFSVCHRTPDTRTIPESYIFVRKIGLLPFETAFSDYARLAKTLSLVRPAAVLCNDGVMVVGETILSAFDKLEVLECSAEAVLDAGALGGHVPMSAGVIDELCEAFHLEREERIVE